MIPDEAVEAAARVLLGYTGGCACHEGYSGRNLIDPDCRYHDVPPEVAREILEAAAPYLLSHEREETRLAHLDAVVNARTVDKLNRAIEKVMLACDAMDMGTRIQSGNPKTTSFAANAIRRSITEELSK